MTTEVLAGVLIALVALALVGLPLLRARPMAHFRNDAEIRAEVERYRAALKAKTVCDRCLAANPPRANYCSECGAAL